jgi:probable phosphoglycerate mutase
MQLVLIRHAHSEANAKGVLSGRISGVHLSATGISQSQALISRLGAISVSELRISPLERCAETINPWWESIGKKKNPSVEIVKDENLIEVDYGKWSGRKLATLSSHKLWKTVQNNPSAMYFPSGEGLAQMQERAMRAVHSCNGSKKRGAAVLVSHGDVIKSIVASCLGMHLDDFQRIVIDPASVTIIDFSSSKPRLILMNDTRANLESFINAPYRKRNLLGGGAGK